MTYDPISNVGLTFFFLLHYHVPAVPAVVI